MSRFRPGRDPARRRQARRRRVDAVGGHQGRPSAGSPRNRAPPADGQRSRRRPRGHLLRGDALGLRRDRALDLRLLARRGRPRGVRNSGADRAVGPGVLRPRGRGQARRLRRHRAAGRLRREEHEDHREARRRRVGARTGPRSSSPTAASRTFTSSSRRSIPSSGTAARLRSWSARTPRACARARRRRRSASAPPTPRRSCSRTAGSRSRTCSAGWTSSNRKLERARSGESSGRASNALATFELTRPARRGLGTRHRSGRVRVDPRLPRQRLPRSGPVRDRPR